MAEHSRVFTCKFYIQDRTELAGPIIAWLWRGEGPYKYIARLRES